MDMVQIDLAMCNVGLCNLYRVNLIQKLSRERMEQEQQASQGAEITEDFLKKREDDELQFRDEMRGHLDSVPNEDDLLTATRLESRRRNDWEEHQEQLGQRLRAQTSSEGFSRNGPSLAPIQHKKAKRFSFFHKMGQVGDADIV